MNTPWTRAFALALSCVGSLGSYGQTAKIDGIGHVAYRVSDLDKSLAFLQKLGFEESFGMTSGGKTTNVFVKINDREFIELYPQTEPSQPLGWMHVCYESDSLNELNALYVTRGLKASSVAKAGAGNLVFSLKDPEGRVTEFTQYMPGSRHTLDRGLHLGAHRVSEELLGFELSVADLAANKKFYTSGLGFEAEDGIAQVRLSIPGAPKLRVELLAAGAGAKPQLLFRVSDAAKATRRFRDMGLAFERHKKLVIVDDPDGNAFVFAEVGSR